MLCHSLEGFPGESLPKNPWTDVIGTCVCLFEVFRLDERNWLLLQAMECYAGCVGMVWSTDSCHYKSMPFPSLQTHSESEVKNLSVCLSVCLTVCL